ncbi:hypothetical protein [Microbacterium stercoris]|uniref:Uncharacterized protein n=1 Tax=Microbacterium stercoris TaxID=2820289 RepID=A0A939TR90_9MICO|nr:hypothetical protein [Microbacterium stercoris]MBO3663901.1 hypothetical protein [Microbacterium stercoris]
MDEAVERAELQRRAYGPAGGIDADGAARLAYLEERHRLSVDQAAPEAPPRSDPGATAEPVRGAGTLPLDPSTTPDGSTPSPASVPPAPTPMPSARPARRWLWGAGGLTLGLVIGAAVMQVVTGPTTLHADRQPDAVLSAVGADDRPERPFPADSVAYSAYFDLDVRSWTETIDGRERHCLGFAALNERVEPGIWSTCTASGLDPVFDIEVWDDEGEGRPMLFGSQSIGGAAVGTQLRFVLDGDVVRVWRIDPPEPTTPDGVVRLDVETGELSEPEA